MTRVSAGLIGVIALGLLAVGAPAHAQSNDEIFPQFQWNFATPGARANAMGRAFIGLADDASASITNPAGLLRLTKPQVYFEYKSTDLRVDRLANQDSFFSPFRTTTASAWVSVPAFFSFSAPLNDKVSVAFTRHEFLNYRETFSLKPRVVPGAITTNFTLFGVDGDSDFSAVTYAGSVAYAVSNKVRVGATLGIDRLSAVSEATRFGIAAGPTFATNKFDVIRRQVGLPAADLIANQTSIDQEDTGISLVLGALFLPTEKVSVGVEYSRGSRLSVDETLAQNPGFLGLASDSNKPLVVPAGFPVSVPINVPDRIGVGIAVRPTPRLLAAFDFVRIGYSSLAKDFVVVLDPGTVLASQFSVANIVETHVGGEYLLNTKGRPMFLRAGVFTSPDHATKFTSVTPPINGDTQAIEQAVYNLLPRTTKIYGSVGIGFVIGTRGQADFAYVGTREFVASVGARF